MASAAPVLLASGYLVTLYLPPAPLWNAVGRVLPAGLLLLVLRPARPRGVWWWRSVALGTLNFGAFFAFQSLAVHRLDPGLAAALNATTTLFAPLLLTPLGVPLRIRDLAASSASVLALGFAAGWLPDAAGPTDVLGVGAALTTALCLAGGKVLTTWWGRPTGVASVSATAWQLLGGGLVLLPVAALTEGAPPTLTGTGWLATVWLAVAATALAYALQLGSLHRGLSASAVSRLALLCPLTTSVLGWLAFQHAPAVGQVAGAMAVVGAIVLGLYWEDALSRRWPAALRRLATAARTMRCPSMNARSSRPQVWPNEAARVNRAA